MVFTITTSPYLHTLQQLYVFCPHDFSDRNGTDILNYEAFGRLFTEYQIPPT